MVNLTNNRNTSLSTPQHETSYLGALSILTSLFFMWGFITCLNDILIPHLKAVFTLSYAQAMLVQFCFFIAYFVVSVPSGYLVEKIDYKGGIIVGLLVAALGCLLFYPASSLHSYPLFLTAFFVLASGITLLQVSANPYVTILGPTDTASSRLTLTQAFNSLGTTLAPYFGTLFILSTAVKSAEEIKALDTDALSTYQAAQAAAVQSPYLLLAAVLFGIAVIFAVLKLPKIQASRPLVDPSRTEDLTADNASAWSYPHLVLGALGIFIYVGSEVSIGSFLISFLGEPNIANLSEQDAGHYVAFYWGGAMVGVGLFNSIMFPTIFSLAVKNLGKHTGQGSGIICAAIVGGAILPLIQGIFADTMGIHHAFFVPALGYLYICYYGWKGHEVKVG